MATWNHRVVRHKGENNEPDWYAIHEVYYDDLGKITGMTVDSASPFGESKNEIKREITNMLAACDKRVIDYDTREELAGYSKWSDIKKKKS